MPFARSSPSGASSPIVALLVLGTSLCAAQPVVKVGIGRVFPISYRAADGKLAGFAVDVLNEAAAREKIAIQWRSVKSSRESEDDLRSGRIDLLPAGMVTPDRQEMFYVSEPWWSTETTLVSRAEDHHGLNRLGINPIYAALAKEAFPKTALVDYQWSDWAIKAVCRGEVDSALIAHGELDDIFLNRPEECNGVRLASSDTRASIQLALITRKADHALASRLRRRIDGMASDGTLMRMAVNNPPIPTAAAAQFEQRLKDRLNRRLFLLGGGLVAVFLLWVVWNRQRTLTRTRRAESELRKLHDRLALKHQVARIGTFEWFVPENRVVWSPEMELLYGISSESHQHTLDEWKALVHPDDLPAVLDAMSEAIAKQQPVLDTTYRVVKRDGSSVWLHSRGRYEYDSDGHPLHMLGVNIDITDQRRAKEELDRANRTMMLAMEAGNSGAWTWSIETGELFWTEAYCRLLGVDAAVKPTPDLFYSIVHPDDLRGVKGDIDACLKGEKREFCNEFRIIRPDSIRWIERRGRICEDHRGKPVELVGISTDITERKILRGMLSTCCQCKKVKDEHDHWQMMERYISDHSQARFSHGLCPDCADAWVAEEGLKGESVAGSAGR
jgi:PAS domain S-box-containing protein